MLVYDCLKVECDNVQAQMDESAQKLLTAEMSLLQHVGVNTVVSYGFI
jgi:hypothetical protein